MPTSTSTSTPTDLTQPGARTGAGRAELRKLVCIGSEQDGQFLSSDFFLKWRNLFGNAVFYPVKSISQGNSFGFC